MKRFLVLMSFAAVFSCDNSSSGGNTKDTSSSSAPVMTDSNNASKNTGTDMSGGANSGHYNNGDTTGIDLRTSDSAAGSRQK